MEEKEVDSMPILNGKPVPVELPLPELAQMLDSADMTDFALACRALSLLQTPDSYELLKSHLPHRDHYRHRCLLEAIFAFPQSHELTKMAEEALRSRREYLVTAALSGIIKGHITLPEKLILSTLEENLSILSGWYFQVLYDFERTEENLRSILELYRSSSGEQRTAIARQIAYFANEENCQQLASLLIADPCDQICLVGIRIAAEFGCARRFPELSHHPDGHVRASYRKGTEKL